VDLLAVIAVVDVEAVGNSQLGEPLRKASAADRNV
jgi:hypothetical protein